MSRVIDIRITDGLEIADPNTPPPSPPNHELSTLLEELFENSENGTPEENLENEVITLHRLENILRELKDD